MRITGSAVVTTRLSSVTMKSATDVIANVQPHVCFVSSSLTSMRKKETAYSDLQPSSSRRPQSSAGSQSIDESTFISIPFAKKRASACRRRRRRRARRS